VSGDFSTPIIEAAVIVGSVLALVAVVLIIGGPDDQDAVVVAGSPPSAIVAPQAQPTAVTSVASGEPASAPATKSEAASSRRGGNPIVWVHNGKRIKMFDAPGGDPVSKLGDETEFGSPSVFAVLRHTDSWVGVSTPLMPNGELGWVKADPRKLLGGYIDYSVVVDLSKRSAKLFDGPKLVRSWPVTVGAKGSATPTGKFAVTDTFRGGLNPVYGCCAVALSATQPDLPSDWLGGNRIAIHGTDGPLGVAESHGCIRSADSDVSVLVSTVPLGTPVRIRR
jgi:hypothetical protein